MSLSPDSANHSVCHRLVCHLLLFIQLLYFNLLAIPTLLWQMRRRRNCCFVWHILAHQLPLPVHQLLPQDIQAIHASGKDQGCIMYLPFSLLHNFPFAHIRFLPRIESSNSSLRPNKNRESFLIAHSGLFTWVNGHAYMLVGCSSATFPTLAKPWLNGLRCSLQSQPKHVVYFPRCKVDNCICRYPVQRKWTM